MSGFEYVDNEEFLTFFLMIIQTNPEADSTSFPSANSRRTDTFFYFLRLFSFLNLYWDAGISGMSQMFVTMRINISTSLNTWERKVLTKTWFPWHAFGLGKNMFLQLFLQLPASGPTQRMVWFSFSLNEMDCQGKIPGLLCTLQGVCKQEWLDVKF